MYCIEQDVSIRSNFEINTVLNKPTARYRIKKCFEVKTFTQVPVLV